MARLVLAACAALAVTAATACSSKSDDAPSSSDDPAENDETANTDDTPDTDDDTPPPFDETTPVAELAEALGGYDHNVLDDVRRATNACRLLGERDGDDARAALLDVARTDLEPTDPGLMVWASCVRALGGHGGAEGGEVETLLLDVIAATSTKPLPVQSAAIDALGAIGVETAIDPIVRVMHTHTRLGDPARLALAAIGPAAVAPLVAALEREPGADEQPGTVAFVAARALGDLRAAGAVAALSASLAQPPRPAMVDKSGELGPAHHVGVIEALRKIGGPEAAAALGRYWKKTDDAALKTMALDAYGLVAAAGKETRGEMKTLLALLQKDSAEPGVRIAAGLAYARLAHTAAHVKALTAAAEAFREAGGDDDHFYRVTAGLIARAEVGVRCKADPSCLADVLTASDDALAARAVEAVPGGDALADEDRTQLAATVRERALLDLRRLGEAGRPALDAILGAVTSDARLVHQTALDALVAVAPRPCQACAEALTAALEAPAKEGPVAARMRMDTEAVLRLLEERDR